MLNDYFINSVKLTKEIPPDAYLRSLPICKYLRKVKEIKFEKPITFFVGENGTGKSTLTEAIAIAYGFNPEGGTKNYNFSTEDTHSELHGLITLVRRGKMPKYGYFLRAESLYNATTYIDKIEKDFYKMSIHRNHRCSHGEAFMDVVERFDGYGLYILDEPEAALSPMRIMQLMCHINKLVKSGSQFIISTHSPLLMTLPNAEILEFSAKGIKKVPYYETEHFQVTRQFVNAPEKYLSILLSDGQGTFDFGDMNEDSNGRKI